SPTTGTAWNTTCAGICGDDATKPAPAGSTSEPDSADHDKITISDCRIWQERRLRATPKGSRALTCFRQAVMVLRWFRGERDIPKLGRDHKVSRATAYRYIDEGIAVLAAQAPDLHGALERARNDGHAYLIMDG